MKRTNLFIKSCFFLICMFVFWSCNNENSNNSNSQTGTSEEENFFQKLGDPGDYFPTKVGMKWTYEVIIGNVKPLEYKITSWPLGGDRSISYISRGLLLFDIPEKKSGHILEFMVSKTAKKQGPFEYPLGVELKVLQDDLGIYHDVEKIFFAVANYKGNRFMANQINLYSSFNAPTMGSWGMWGQGSGSSIQLMFFGDSPGLQMGMGTEPEDVLLFLGFEGGELHFQRSVIGNTEMNDGNDYINSGFVEDTWYRKGIGLVRLEQRVGGKISMIWRLNNSKT